MEKEAQEFALLLLFSKNAQIRNIHLAKIRPIWSLWMWTTNEYTKKALEKFVQSRGTYCQFKIISWK
jgi:hypothetical protein